MGYRLGWLSKFAEFGQRKEQQQLVFGVLYEERRWRIEKPL
jgi:hypothetical protein